MAGKPQEVFEGAVDLVGAEREAHLRGVCGADQSLRAEVDGLFRAFERGVGFLVSPTASLPANAAAAVTVGAPIREGAGTRIGPYKLLQLIGEGGFGSVFMAEQEKPVSRRVALKIIKLGMDTRQVVARFEQERQALALMDHPNIARVLDAGATDTGRPFFVMELVKGDPIAEYCDKNNLSIADRLELFAEVCNAVQHAHTKGIIHRDIKPSNILVSNQDGRARTKVIDFGIAKATASKLTEKTLFTEHRALIGTPEYMSPEQAEGSMDIDTRTDVYSLGVLLYELLTGTTPFSNEELRSAAYAEIQRIIREVEPPKPSTRISHNTGTIANVAARRHTEPKKLGTIVRGELDWIVMKALEKSRQRRYETANGLAMDIQRYLAGEAVLAAPPGTVYRLRTFVRRHKGQVVAASVVLLALVVGVIAVVAVQRRANLLLEGKNAELLDANTKAEERFRQAKAAVDKYFTGVSESRLLDVPGLQPLRRELLGAAAQYYKDFLSKRGDDPNLQSEAGSAYIRVGWIDQALGKQDEAAAAYESAVEICESLVRAHPDNIEYRRLLATGYGAKGLLLGDGAKRDESIAAHRRALEIREAIVAQNPDDALALIDVARSHSNIAGEYRRSSQPDQALAEWDKAVAIGEPLLTARVRAGSAVVGLTGRSDLSVVVRGDMGSTYLERSKLLHDLGRLDDAQAPSKRAQELFEVLAAERPDDLGLRKRLCDCIAQGAKIELSLGNLEAARALFRRAIDIQRPMVAANPSIAWYGNGLADNLLLMGWAMGRLERYPEALDAFANVIEAAERSLVLEPGSDDASNMLAQGLSQSANLLMRSGRPAEALPLARRAVSVHEVLVRKHPEAAFHQSALGSALRALGRAEAALKNPADAFAAFERAAQVAQPLLAENPTEVQNYACDLALMATVCQPELRSSLIDQSLEALRRASQLRAAAAKVFREDPDLAPLRERPEFEEILARMESQTGPEHQTK